MRQPSAARRLSYSNASCIQRGGLTSRGEFGSTPSRDAREVLGVEALDGIGLAFLIEPLRRELPQALEHREPRTRRIPLFPDHEAGIDQVDDLIERLSASRQVGDGCGCLGGPSTAERRKPAKEPLRRWIEELIAPGDRGAKALVAW